MEIVEEFLIAERSYCDDDSKASVGLANIRAEVPDIEANKDKIVRACKIFKERGVNVAIFPEFCLSGYFWDERDDCHAYMEQACTDHHTDWLDSELRSMLDETFRGIVLNNLPQGEGRSLLQHHLRGGRRSRRSDPDNSYDKVFLPGVEKEYTDSGRDDRLVLETDLRPFRLHHLLRLPLLRLAARVLGDHGPGGRQHR